MNLVKQLKSVKCSFENFEKVINIEGNDSIEFDDSNSSLSFILKTPIEICDYYITGDDFEETLDFVRGAINRRITIFAESMSPDAQFPKCRVEDEFISFEISGCSETTLTLDELEQMVNRDFESNDLLHGEELMEFEFEFNQK